MCTNIFCQNIFSNNNTKNKGGDFISNIEIIGITMCGTYPAWTEYTIASFYNHVDKIILTNSGYDINEPNPQKLEPLRRDSSLVKKIDIYNKVIEINPTQDQINNLFKTTLRNQKDEIGRSTSMTISTQAAHALPNPGNKQRWILKLDNDQILYPMTRQDLENLISQYPTKSGFRFAQYADYYHDFEHIGSLPHEFTNDGSLFHKSLPNQGYCGQGSPGYIKVSQYPITSIRTSHMRRINPPDVDPYEYHFKRIFYHTFAPDSIMELDYNRKTGKHLTYEQIIEISHKEAVSILRQKGNNINDLSKDERIPYEPPLVCTLSPLTYIKRGY